MITSAITCLCFAASFWLVVSAVKILVNLKK